MKEAQYWGRELPARQDLPAFWSVRMFGNPFNDGRLFNGANNHYQVRRYVFMCVVAAGWMCCLSWDGNTWVLSHRDTDSERKHWLKGCLLL